MNKLCVNCKHLRGDRGLLGIVECHAPQNIVEFIEPVYGTKQRYYRSLWPNVARENADNCGPSGNWYEERGPSLLARVKLWVKRIIFEGVK